MKIRVGVWLAALFSLLSASPGAQAHVGSKDVFEQLTAGPYHLFVTVRPPTVVPGVATVEVRTGGPAVTSLDITPLPLTGEASRHPPTPDRMQRSAEDPAFFTGSLWIMTPGSWQVRLEPQGAGGRAAASVPVPAMALSVLRMQRPMGLVLALLGLVLVLGMTGIVYSAVREARLAPGASPSAERRRRALLAAAGTLGALLLAVWAGGHWWNVEAAAYSADIFRPLTLHPSLHGDLLDLRIDPGTPDDRGRGSARSNTDLLPDHGHLMHLYAIRWPEMDAVYHLHPAKVGRGELQTTLPAMPEGTYRLFADIVHRNGFPETLTSALVVPSGTAHGKLDAEDASAFPPPLMQGNLGSRYKLPDGYTMVWERPVTLTADTAELFRFHLLDPAGRPATDMQPYLGMAGHAAFIKTDGTVFAHTHPDGSAAMPAMMIANEQNGDSASSDMAASSMADMNSSANTGMGGVDAARPGTSPQALSPTVDFPYGFPAPGRYRIFVQMKHGGTVETGVFDAEVGSRK